MAKMYCVEIHDDELRPKRWRQVAFEITEQLDKESYRATMGAFQPIVRYTTEDILEASAKKTQMISNGWKARIKIITKEE